LQVYVTIYVMISFEAGKPFPNESSTQSRRTRAFTARKVREAVVESSRHLVGEAVLIPNVRNLAKALGISASHFYNHGSYGDNLSHATGLTFVEHHGPLLIPEGTQITPLADGPRPVEPSVDMEITERITELASTLSSEAKQQLGRLLLQEDQHS
jgi:hypothetical protein